MVKDFMRIMRISFPDGIYPVHGKVFVDFEIEYQDGQFGIFKVWFPVQNGNFMTNMMRYAEGTHDMWVKPVLAKGMTRRLAPLLEGFKEEARGEVNET